MCVSFITTNSQLYPLSYLAWSYPGENIHSIVCKIDYYYDVLIKLARWSDIITEIPTKLSPLFIDNNARWQNNILRMLYRNRVIPYPMRIEEPSWPLSSIHQHIQYVLDGTKQCLQTLLISARLIPWIYWNFMSWILAYHLRSSFHLHCRTTVAKKSSIYNGP